MMLRLVCLFLLSILLFNSLDARFTSDIRVKELFQKSRQVQATGEQPNYPDYFMDIPLDHFSTSDNRTFKNRYLMEDKFCDKTGVVILHLGGESEIGYWNLGGNYFKLAKMTGALVVVMEHRYYGQSIPFPDLSVKSLKYLTVDQAMEDVAYFAQNFKVPEKCQNAATKKVKWVAMGGSYPGNMAAWARKQYPDIFHAAYASSAPVRQELDFYQYDLAVLDGLVHDSAVSLTAAIEEIDTILDNGNRSVIYELKKKFGLEKIDNDDLFASSIVDPFSSMLQYGKWGEVSEFAQIPKVNKSDPKNLEDIIRFYGNTFKNFMVKYNVSADYYLDTTVSDRIEDSPWGGRQWLWQSCTEFAYWQTAPKPPLPRGRSRRINQTSYEEGCYWNFGKENVPKHAAVEYVNQKYGSDRISTPRIAFINGDIDPYARLSVSAPDAWPRDYSSLDQPVFVIERGSHCEDMYGDAPGDRKNLTMSRQFIDDAIVRFLNQP